MSKKRLSIPGVIDAGVPADIGLVDLPVEAGQPPLDVGVADAGLLDAGPADTWINPESPEGRGLTLYTEYCGFATARAVRGIGLITPTRWRIRSS